MPAVTAAAVPDADLVVLALDPALLPALAIGQHAVAATMTRQQAHELLWALEATLGGDSQGTDDDASCGDPDCPGPHVCEVPTRLGCGDPDCPDAIHDPAEDGEPTGTVIDVTPAADGNECTISDCETCASQGPA